MTVDWLTLLLTAALSAVVSWITASTVAGRSERGRRAFEARQAVRKVVSPFLLAVAQYQTEHISGLGRSGSEHVQLDIAFAYKVRVAARDLSWLRLLLVRRRLRRLTGARWMTVVEQGNLEEYTDDEATRLFCNAVDQTSRDLTIKPDGLIATALQSPPYSAEVKDLRSNLEALSRAR